MRPDREWASTSWISRAMRLRSRSAAASSVLLAARLVARPAACAVCSCASCTRRAKARQQVERDDAQLRAEISTRLSDPHGRRLPRVSAPRARAQSRSAAAAGETPRSSLPRTVLPPRDRRSGSRGASTTRRSSPMGAITAVYGSWVRRTTATTLATRTIRATGDTQAISMESRRMGARARHHHDYHDHSGSEPLASSEQSAPDRRLRHRSAGVLGHNWQPRARVRRCHRRGGGGPPGRVSPPADRGECTPESTRSLRKRSFDAPMTAHESRLSSESHVDPNRKTH